LGSVIFFFFWVRPFGAANRDQLNAGAAATPAVEAVNCQNACSFWNAVLGVDEKMTRKKMLSVMTTVERMGWAVLK
jgi:hypothetical protein